MTELRLRVHGVPGPQGSKTVFQGGGMRESSKKVKPWREAVKSAWLDTYPDSLTVMGPVVLSAWFVFKRPASHYRTGRNAHLLRDSAPTYPTGKTSAGDLSKLLRSTEDALTDVGAWQDDCWVVSVAMEKRYGDWQGVDLTIRPV